MLRIVFVSDEGANLLSALDGFDKSPCCCHICHLLSKRATLPYAENYMPHLTSIDDKNRQSLATVEQTVKDTLTLINTIRYN